MTLYVRLEDGTLQKYEGTLYVRLEDGTLQKYEGTYSVTPSTADAQTLPTAEKYLENDITVQKIPYYEVDNSSGGTTVYIGSDNELSIE